MLWISDDRRVNSKDNQELCKLIAIHKEIVRRKDMRKAPKIDELSGYFYKYY